MLKVLQLSLSAKWWLLDIYQCFLQELSYLLPKHLFLLLLCSTLLGELPFLLYNLYLAYEQGPNHVRDPVQTGDDQPSHSFEG